MDKVVKWLKEKWELIIIAFLLVALSASIGFNISFKLFDGEWEEKYNRVVAELEEYKK